MIKVITGVKRCGKSYLLNEIFNKYLSEKGIDENHIIRFAFDSEDDLEKNRRKHLRNKYQKQKGRS